MCGVVLLDGALGVGALGGVVPGVVAVPLEAALPLPVVVPLELGAAEAPAMPEAAPPAASAPATIVAPSILEMFMSRPPGGCVDGFSAILAFPAKARRRLL
jgi:hypothetical protein